MSLAIHTASCKAPYSDYYSWDNANPLQQCVTESANVDVQLCTEIVV